MPAPLLSDRRIDSCESRVRTWDVRLASTHYHRYLVRDDGTRISAGRETNLCGNAAMGSYSGMLKKELVRHNLIAATKAA